ncbi:FadR/GntR family transcriptional regulator [Variovorax ginsengisoli]|uniref:DNA-binding FadR family transcriptional regulator n=1 Tax=Variovorax ginsengisoli TaxID=363844 RepID=A0ABT9S7K6_9BURK|nr:GntR family transcriptional regulator [Variovorax ginsengisoli]MDP9899332.1 DNA-binding FadR family transcriptional regulator [Variovorax ginsengisoli]
MAKYQTTAARPSSNGPSTSPSSAPVDVADLSDRIAAQDKATASKVYRAILQSIRDGVLKPGDKLPNERDLSAQFQTSRGTVRHALAMMSTQGLLVRKVGSGTFLAETLLQLLSETDLPVAAHHENVPTYGEILEGRLLFEPAMMALSAQRADEEDFALMRRHLAAVRDADQWIDFKEGIYGVHQAIYRATRNRFMMQVFEAVVTDRRAVQYDGRSSLHSPVGTIVREKALRELTAIVDALQARDAKAATRLATDYFTQILASLSVYG